MTPAAVLDLASVFVFALTGALAASRAQLDIVGFLFFSAITAVGGGTVRDLLLDRNPVFWIAEPQILLAVLPAVLVVYLGAHLVESRLRWLTWLDAAALAIAVPAGLTVAIGLGHTGAIAVMMGVITGTMGGLLRDVVANEVPMVLRQGELYVTAAFAGALLGIAVYPFAGLFGAVLASGLLTFGLRAGSLIFGWHVPVFRSRPPR